MASTDAADVAVGTSGQVREQVTGLATEQVAEQVAQAGALAKEAGSQVAASANTAMASNAFSWSGYFTAIGTLLILLALLWGLVWALRKSGRFNFIPRPGMFPRNGLQIEAQLPLGPRKGLTVVRFLDKRLLLGVTENTITLLQEVEDKHDSTDFASLLEQEEHKPPQA